MNLECVSPLKSSQAFGGSWESFNDTRIAHEGHEPRGIPLNRPVGTFSPTGGLAPFGMRRKEFGMPKVHRTERVGTSESLGRDEGARFMGRSTGRD